MNDPKLPDVPFKYLLLHHACKNHLGVLASQAGHCAEESVRALPVSKQTTYCVLEAGCSEDIEEQARVLERNGIDFTIIREPDAPWNGAATALATAALPRSVVNEMVKPLFVGFKLLK